VAAAYPAHCQPEHGSACNQPPSCHACYDAPAPPPRFDARARQYKYYLLQDGSLDLGAMRSAAVHLVGVHDFRNFCKADVVQVSAWGLDLPSRHTWRACETPAHC
jgi:hypothetical protein